MKAVIMAGGEGSRLRPLTCDMPKPMARLCGRPIIEYILELLAKNGVTQAAITLRYLPHRIIEHFADSTFSGIQLDFVEENEPLGTAGGVKNACKINDDDLLVISGDALCDFNLMKMCEFHKFQNADVTILSKKVNDPREFGLIVANDSGEITGFLEKPAFSQAVSDLANTGIYILSPKAIDMIPKDRSFDFAKDLFPLMLQQNMKILSYEGDGYWCDIGDLDSYIKCQQDMLNGLVECDIHGVHDKNGNIYAGDVPHTKFMIQPPVYIGRNVKIEESAIIESGCVLDDGCWINSSARISASILLQNCHIGRHAKLTGSLVCAKASVKAGAMLFEASTVGSGAVIGERAIVNPGVKIWNNKSLPAEAIALDHIKTSAQSRTLFDDDGISGEIGIELTPEFAARVGSAIGSLNPKMRIAVGCSTHRGAVVLKSALSAGIRSTGSDMIDFGENFQSQFEFSMNFCALDIGVFIRGDNKSAIKVMCSGGLPATRDMERSIEGILSRGEFIRRASEDMGDKIDMGGMAPMYRSQLSRSAPKGLVGCKAKVKSYNLAVQNTLKEALYRLGCDDSDGLTLEISSQGDKVRISDPDFGYIHHHMIFAWCCLGELERGVDIAIPYDSPRMIDEMGIALGRSVMRYFACPADDSDSYARDLAKSQMWSRDALMQAVMFLSIAKKAGGVSALMQKTPNFYRSERTVDMQGSARALKTFNSSENGVAEGVLINHERGIILMQPLKKGTGIKIFAESINAETAKSMCDELEEKLLKISKT